MFYCFIVFRRPSVLDGFLYSKFRSDRKGGKSRCAIHNFLLNDTIYRKFSSDTNSNRCFFSKPDRIQADQKQINQGLDLTKEYKIIRDNRYFFCHNYFCKRK